ncbi:MAG: hypothetical protein MZW92_60440 [Comamonadaceae bacterium]|nr:hypothetical protein [Comamonadaceae bacterium]
MNHATRALVLYSLAEFQAGYTTAIAVDVTGWTFQVSDDGRGHSLTKVLAGSPYLHFIYTHFDYPFGNLEGAPVQLQGIGMSLLNALCSELTVTVRKANESSLTVRFRDGQLDGKAFDVTQGPDQARATLSTASSRERFKATQQTRTRSGGG